MVFNVYRFEELNEEAKEKESKKMKKTIVRIALVSMVSIGVIVGYSLHKANTKTTENIPRVEKIKSPYADYKPKSTQSAPKPTFAPKKPTVPKKETSTTAPRERNKTAEELITITDATFTLDGNYVRFEAKVTNGSDRTVDYFKYDIFGANDKGDIVVCEWSNWSGTLPSGASTTIDTMFKYNPEGTRYGAIMNKISYAY